LAESAQHGQDVSEAEVVVDLFGQLLLAQLVQREELLGQFDVLDEAAAGQFDSHDDLTVGHHHGHRSEVNLRMKTLEWLID